MLGKVKNQPAGTSIVRVAFIAVLVDGFPNTEQCTTLAVRLAKDGQLELFLLYGDKGYRRLSLSFSQLRIFSYPECLAVFIQSMDEKKIGRVNGLIKEARFPK